MATHRRLVEQMQREGLWYASLAHIDVLEQQGGSTPTVLRLRADALRQTGQTAASRAAYTQLSRAPNAADAAAGLHGLGLLAGGEGDFVQAATWLEQARQRSPADARVIGDLGYARLLAGQLAQARVPLMQAAQLQPEDLRAQLNLAAWLLASDQGAQAEQVLAALKQGEASRAAVQQTAAQARAAAAAALAGAPEGRDAAAPAVVEAGMPMGAAATQVRIRRAPLALRSSTWKEVRSEPAQPGPAPTP
ncbi:hypothetical protein [Xenophilus sp. Marseille-Q4582]|uniref:hypothetical protein n=1 Tax=Xenophilus sp. Marseille-Q4582 TaxID=2866600 RepID=UPI001CE3F9CC|nr:hypothetical protein [Xenophilus sp. Marseille-Q4582]